MKTQMNKQYPLTIILSLFISIGSYACEICGCGHSNFQIGLLPNFTKGFVGLRYTTSQFNSTLSADASQFSHDYYKTMEVWGGYNIKKWQVMAFIPYLSTRKVSDDGTTEMNGLGDITLLINYKVLGSVSLSKNEKTTVRHDLYVGGGIKLPTGANKIDTSNPGFNIGDFNSQAGTGSTDFIFNVTHNLLWNRSGIVTNLTYRANTSNEKDYRYGNRAYANMAYYYTFGKGEIKVRPNMGLNYQSNAINSFAGTDVEGSNGYNLNALLGANIARKKVGVIATAFIPLSQDNYNGQTKLQSRVVLGLTYSF
jgi:hypothetical protein